LHLIIKLMEERFILKKNGQWSLEKWNVEKRCWEGYEPVPGKEPYEKGSCRPVKKVEVAPKDSVNRETYKENFEKSLEKAEIELVEWTDSTIDLVVGEDVSETAEQALVKTLEDNGYEEISKKEWHPKAEHKSDKGGLTEAGRKSYNRATGGNLKAPQPQGGPRKRSFCARNKGQIQMHGIDCKKDPDKRACKARRRWKCTN
jgi:hypothetical protein